MLNIDKTKIIKVFRLSKDASKEILQHPSAMCCAIKHSTPLNNFYWFRWENVASTLQNEFLQSNPLPVEHHNVRGIKINLLRPNTNEIIKTFASYTEIQKELKISVRKIKELMESNESYNGKYRFTLCWISSICFYCAQTTITTNIRNQFTRKPENVCAVGYGHRYFSV